MTGLVTLGSKADAPLDAGALLAKQERLFAGLRSLGRVLVAYSGGTDSAYLAWAARQACGANMLAVTADSASIPESHKRDAADFARQFDIPHEVIESREFENPAYSANNPDRCFHCKDELFRRMKEIAPRYPDASIVYGVNCDDLGDYRPGQQAARQHDVLAPLVDAGLNKAEIRELSRLAGLPTWDRPAAACLSSRIPYGTQVTPENVKQVEAGEEALKSLGFRQYRVRYHGELARIEFSREELPRALTLEIFEEISRIFHGIGFTYVAVDVDGYRQGAMNEAIGKKNRVGMDARQR
jgi:uncharacterized protein